MLSATAAEAAWTWLSSGMNMARGRTAGCSCCTPGYWTLWLRNSIKKCRDSQQHASLHSLSKLRVAGCSYVKCSARCSGAAAAIYPGRRAGLSVSVGGCRRDEALAAIQESIRAQQQQELSIDMEIQGYKKDINKEQVGYRCGGQQLAVCIAGLFLFAIACCRTYCSLHCSFMLVDSSCSAQCGRINWLLLLVT